MKNKIKEALRQEYKKRLELDDEQLNGVAAFAATFVTEEAKIEEFVKNDATLEMLKSYQRMLDKDRAKRKADGEQGQQGSETSNQSQAQNQQQAAAQPDLATAIAAAVAEQMKAVVTPLQEKLTLFEAEKAIEGIIADVNARIDAWGYGKGYPKEMEKARKHAMELYEAYGKKWTADELEAKIKEKFNMEVHDKGIDTTQPFKGDGGGGADHKSRFEAMAKRQAERQGAVAAEQTQV